jgi:tetratricopeptide (TPR) repeat protein
MLKILYGLFIILTFSGCSVIRDTELESADDALLNSRYQTAIHFANLVLEKDSLNAAEAYLIRGKAYSQLNESESAFKDFNTLLNIHPGFDPYYNRGLEYLKNKSYSTALEDFSKAIDYDKYNSEAYFTRAYTKYLLDDSEGAIKDYEKVIELDSTSFKAYVNIGNILGSLGYGELAIERFNKAISLQPDNPDGYFNRGNQKLIMDDLEGGIDDLERSLEIDWENVNALMLLAELKLKAGDNIGLFEILNRILSIEENPKALYMRGSVYLKFEDRNNACSDFNRAGELGYFEAYEMINKYCVKTKKKKSK